MKIRIFALAKELNLDSKELIEACAAIGVVLKNSALASISPEERDKVVAHINRATGGRPAASPAAGSAPSPQAGKPAPMTPVREVPRAVGTKVPELKSVSPRPQLSRLGPREPLRDNSTSATAVAESPEISASGEADTQENDVEEVSQETADVENRSEVDEPQSTATESETEADEAADDIATSSEITDSISDQGTAISSVIESEVEAPTASSKPAEGTRKAPFSPMSRTDYIPAHGAASRPMRSRDTSTDASKAPKKPKPKPGPSLPSLAPLGRFKGPAATAKPVEAPAQKPDLKLPADLLTSPRPLHDILKKNAEEKKRKKIEPIDVTVEMTDESPTRSKTAPKAGGAGAGLSTSRKDRQARRSRPGVEEESGEAAKSRFRATKRNRRPTGVAALKTSAELAPPITIRTLSEAIGRPASGMIKSLFLERGMQVTMNSSLDEETALELALAAGVDLVILHERDIEAELEASLEQVEAPENLQPRPPIITILGHVDHGKTTLLDTIRSANVVAGEAGGITQHIAAYQVEYKGHKITFVDTPGHAAFGEMRARGANVTDIVVLVVAADDGVMPQTAEAISHAKAAGVPIVVALNKCDLPTKNEQKVLQELSTHGVLPVEWGGDTEIVRTAGLTGLGIEDLLQTLLLTAELHEFQGNPNAEATGVCLEAFRDEGRGAIAWLMVQRGTLRLGDTILCGAAYGRIRAMYNDRDEEVSEAGLSMPVKISGLDIVPNPGDKFFVHSDFEEARQVAESRRQRGRTKVLSERGKPRTLEDLLDPTKAGGVRDLPLIIKADTPGSLEAIRHELGKFSHPEVRVKILHEGVGGVNESDIYLASAGQAIIIAFHVVPDERARVLSEREGVEVRQYSIIYEVTDHIRKALEGLLKPELHQIATGRALVLRTFNISRFGMIAGCRVLNGTIERANRMRLIRDQRILNEYGIASLKREKEDTREVREGMECGIRLEGFNDFKEGDLLEAFRVEEVKRTL